MGFTMSRRSLVSLLLPLLPSVGLLILFSYLAETAHGQVAYSKQATISETGGIVRLTANDSRPLEQALTALQQKYGWLVDYEDPQYTSKLDLVDAKPLQDKSFYPNGEHRVPGGGSFIADLGAVSTAGPDEQKTLQLLIDSYNRSSNPGRFELRPDKDRPGVFDVVGIAAHDSQGHVSQQQPLLDLPVTITAEQRTVSDTIDLICQKVAEKSEVKVTLGVYPLGLDHANVTVGGKELAARAYLSHAFESTGRKLVWRLLYDPDSNAYFLNLHQVRLP